MAQLPGFDIEGIQVDLSDGYCLVRSGTSLSVISTAPVGAEHRTARSLLNITVPHDFDECMAPEGAVARVADAVEAPLPRVGMLTAVPMHRAVTASESDGARRVVVFATVGADHPVRPGEFLWNGREPGTINLIVLVDDNLSPTALAECLTVATEAKALAMYESGPTTASGAPATGTSTDATIIAATQRGAIERYAGPVTPVGFLVGKAVRRAVAAGLPAER